MKDKIVNYIAGEAAHTLAKADLELTNMCDKYNQVFADTTKGIGLDMAVLREQIQKASDLIHLLT